MGVQAFGILLWVGGAAMTKNGFLGGEDDLFASSASRRRALRTQLRHVDRRAVRSKKKTYRGFVLDLFF
jgi:hypothetical protein